jgi:hypothetical protein
MSTDYRDKFFILDNIRDMTHARLEASRLFGDEVLMVWAESQWTNYLGHTHDKRFNLRELSNG